MPNPIKLSTSNMSTSPRLCHICATNIFIPTTFTSAWHTLLTTFSSSFQYSASWSTITASASSGCSWCSLILSLRETTDNAFPWVRIEVRLRKDRAGKIRPKGVETLNIWVNGAPRASFWVYTSEGNPAEKYVTARSLVRKLASKKSMQMALEYLQHCENEHDECRRVIMVDPDSTRRRGAIPTRLIDCGRLGSTDNGAGSRIWIVDTSITAVDGVHGSISHNHPYHQYAALSYVWGDPTTNNSQATACSTTTNITDRMTEGLETRLLPATVRDAVKVTQELGVRWLWIDALCILQDSKDDKIRELPKMRAIYRGAIFTIMAASANGSSEGFLGDREPGNDKYDPEIPFLVPYHNNNNEIHNKLKTGTIFLSPVWKQYDESQEPINSRAWCLQERILSPRALIYASHTLQYRCIRETTSIGHAICAPSVTSSGLDLAPLLNLHGGTNLNSPHSIPQLELRHLWNSIVEEYSRRYLTVPGDKLPAIAAVGDSFHYCFTANCYPRYLAGIWHLRDHSSEYSTENLSLIRGLLWFKSYTSRFPRPEVYRAPSWSWAAVDGHVIMENLDDRVREGRCSPGDVEACCDIMECVTVLKHPTVPFGEVEDAVLRVRAVVVEVECELPEELPVVEWEGRRVAVAFVDGLEEEKKRRDEDEDGTRKKINRLWAVPLLRNSRERYAEGILVAACTKRGEERFRRVGYFHSEEESPDVAEWMQMFERREICIV